MLGVGAAVVKRWVMGERVKITRKHYNNFDCEVLEYGETKSRLCIDIGCDFEYGWVDNSEIEAVGMLFGSE
jgi:hypothetical protein